MYRVLLFLFMPELPEVETIRRDLKKKIINKKIINVWLSPKAIVKGSKNDFLKVLKNNKFIGIERIGKLLIFVLSENRYLLTHLKMTGQLVYQHGHQVVAGGHPEPTILELPNKFTRISFVFANGGKLYFNDIRRFGYMQIVDNIGLVKVKQKFGLEPLDKKFTFAYFKKVLANKNKAIKIALMDQDKIAGIGNIYASEACFEAKIKPTRNCSTLSDSELKLLRLACIKVLKVAVKNRGTTFSDYVDAAGRGGYNISFLKVYDREGKVCKRKDGGTVEKVILGGRGSFYCPKCQK